MTLLTYAPILSFTIPRSHCQRFPFLPFYYYYFIYGFFSHFGVYRRFKRICFRFRDTIKVRRLVHAARRHVFRSDFTLEHYTLNSYVFYFPIPLPSRQEHVKQFDSPLSQWQHVVLGVTLGGMVTNKIDLYITIF